MYYIQHRATSAMRIDDSVVKKCLFLTGARVECRPKLLGLSWKKILWAQFWILEDFFFRFIFKFLLSSRQFELGIYSFMRIKSQQINYSQLLIFTHMKENALKKLIFASDFPALCRPRSDLGANLTLSLHCDSCCNQELFK